MGPARRWPVISALGVIQILTWGSSFYLPAVLAGPIADGTGWPLAWVVGGLSVGLLAAAFASPRVGLAIHRHGGRPVLALAAVLLAVGLAVLGDAPNLPVYLAGWIVIGLGMGCGLYDPAFRDARPPLRVRRAPRHHDADPMGWVRQHGLLAALGLPRRADRMAWDLPRLCRPAHHGDPAAGAPHDPANAGTGRRKRSAAR